MAGGWADEGKGKVTAYVLERYNVGHEVLCIRSSGGTNTGATVYRRKSEEDWLKIQIHMLPVGVFLPGGKHGYIGNNVYLNLDILEDELKLMNKIGGGNLANRVFISKYAHVVTKQCLEEDARKERKQKLGSTKNGVSIAAGKKYRYEGLTLEKFLTKPGSGHIRTVFDVFNVEVVDPYEFFTEIVEPQDWNIVIEGTQGVGLDVNHGNYPYVSSGSFSTYGLLDGVGYTLAPDEVYMCLKPYNSYFGPLRMKGDFDDDEFRQFAGEYGTTTKRPRNLSWLDTADVRRAAQLIQPTHLVVNHFDSLNWFAENGKEWKLWVDGEMSMGFSDKAWVDSKLTRQGAMFLDTLKEVSKVKKIFIGTGPKSSDIIEYR